MYRILSWKKAAARLKQSTNPYSFTGRGRHRSWGCWIQLLSLQHTGEIYSAHVSASRYAFFICFHSSTHRPQTDDSDSHISDLWERLINPSTISLNSVLRCLRTHSRLKKSKFTLGHFLRETIGRHGKRARAIGRHSEAAVCTKGFYLWRWPTCSGGLSSTLKRCPSELHFPCMSFWSSLRSSQKVMLGKCKYIFHRVSRKFSHNKFRT